MNNLLQTSTKNIQILQELKTYKYFRKSYFCGFGLPKAEKKVFTTSQCITTREKEESK